MSTPQQSQNGHTTLEKKQSPKMVDYEQLLALGRALLIAIGEDPEREGLHDTPRRFADAWREFIEYDPGTTDTCFASASSDQIVCVSDIHVTSICEHHLMAFTCNIAIGYIPDEKVLGLSKFARIAHQYAHRLQLQERLGEEIADEVGRITGSLHVAVLIRGKHLCMSTRGIRTPGTMTTSVMRGQFRADPQTRAEFFRMIGDHQPVG
jgi:GTP cyclohydrolase I